MAKQDEDLERFKEDMAQLKSAVESIITNHGEKGFEVVIIACVDSVGGSAEAAHRFQTAAMDVARNRFEGEMREEAQREDERIFRDHLSVPYGEGPF